MESMEVGVHLLNGYTLAAAYASCTKMLPLLTATCGNHFSHAHVTDPICPH